MSYYEGNVYIAKVGRRIKVGFSYNVKLRLRRIELQEEQCAVLLASRRGTFKNERSIHRALQDFYTGKTNRSWYRPTAEVMAFIKIFASPSFRWDKCKLLVNADARYRRLTEYGSVLRAAWKRVDPMAKSGRRGGDISKIFRTNLLAIATAYASALDISLQEVSKQVYGRTAFFDEFKAGKASPSLVKIDEMIAYFRRNWPEGESWPFLQSIFIGRFPKER